MKKKPDISSFTQPTKDPNAFLEGASADQSEIGPVLATRAPVAKIAPLEAPSPLLQDEAVMPIATVQKLFRLRWDTANALRMAAATLSTKQAKRVTETEIVETLIREHFKIDR
jgi:hypothetical protein